MNSFFSDDLHLLNDPQWHFQLTAFHRRLSSRAGIPPSAIKGFRAPFLSVGSDQMYDKLKAEGIEYDSSITVRTPRYSLYDNFYIACCCHCHENISRI